MLVRDKGRSTYLLNFNPQIWLWHYQLDHASNIRIVQVSKLIDGIYIKKIITKPFDKPHFSDSKSESNSDADQLSLINKIIELNIDGMKKLYEVYIKNNNTRIIKSKRITPIMRR